MNWYMKAKVNETNTRQQLVSRQKTKGKFLSYFKIQTTLCILPLETFALYFMGHTASPTFHISPDALCHLVHSCTWLLNHVNPLLDDLIEVPWHLNCSNNSKVIQSLSPQSKMFGTIPKEAKSKETLIKTQEWQGPITSSGFMMHTEAS